VKVEQKRYLLRSVFCWLALAPLIVAILFPFAVMLSTALKPATEILTPKAHWFGTRLALENFVTMWQATRFGQTLLNSLFVSILSTAAAILVAIPAAYALSRQAFRGSGLFRQFLLISQMLSPIVLVLGLFRLIVAAGLIDSLSAVAFVYACFNIAFAVWMMQCYFATIPVELEEAAWLEGASRWNALRQVFLPLAVPAIAVTAIFTFVQAWTEFVLALTLIRSQDSYTLPIQVFSLVAGRYTIEWHHVMAATFLATMPVAIVFAALQRYLVSGLSLGAVK
jgi:multiple sugar transport system permease protein